MLFFANYKDTYIFLNRETKTIKNLKTKYLLVVFYKKFCICSTLFFAILRRQMLKHLAGFTFYFNISDILIKVY